MGQAADGVQRLSSVEYRVDPRVLIVGDTQSGRERLRHAAEYAGCRTVASVRIEGAAARIARQCAADAVLVALANDQGEEQDRILDALVHNAGPSIVVSAANLIDAVAARIGGSAVAQLCEPTLLDLVAEIAVAVATPAARLHDVRKSPATVRLQQLSEELGRVATVLASLSEDEAAAVALVGGESHDSQAERVESGQIRAMIRARRLRDHFFRGELFADPAWDMLLDLMAARIEKQRVAVSSLCIAAAVPPTTALRWIKSLCDQGIFVRVADPEDGRRVFIELSDDSAAAMENYLKAANRISPLIV